VCVIIYLIAFIRVLDYLICILLFIQSAYLEVNQLIYVKHIEFIS
jgi:hypothetical protein